MLFRAPVGVNSLCKVYGVRKNNGCSPSHWVAGSGSIARKALQVLFMTLIILMFPTVIKQPQQHFLLVGTDIALMAQLWNLFSWRFSLLLYS
jgi:Ribosomal protein S19e